MSSTFLVRAKLALLALLARRPTLPSAWPNPAFVSLLGAVTGVSSSFLNPALVTLRDVGSTSLPLSPANSAVPLALDRVVLRLDDVRSSTLVGGVSSIT